MKNYFKNIFSKDCSWIEYLSFGISLFMLIVSIAYLTINPGELKIEDYSRTFCIHHVSNRKLDRNNIVLC